MNRLKEKGVYSIGENILAKLKSDFYGNCAGDDEAAETIKYLFEKYNYLCDTHTAVAVNVYRKYLEETGDNTPCVIASTASPYKFAPAVLEAVSGKKPSGSEFDMVAELSESTGTKIPAPLAGLADKAVLHTSCVEKEDMAKFIADFLGV